MTPEQQTPASVVERQPVSNPYRLAEGVVAFLAEAARYFEKRPTGGEDAAHWSNIYNAKNCRTAAALIERLSAERDEAQAENSRWLIRMEAIREASGVGVLPMLSELPDAIAAKMAGLSAEREGLREALEALLASTVGPKVFGGDGGTFVVSPPSAGAIRQARAALTQGESRGGGE